MNTLAQNLSLLVKKFEGFLKKRNNDKNYP